MLLLIMPGPIMGSSIHTRTSTTVVLIVTVVGGNKPKLFNGSLFGASFTVGLEVLFENAKSFLLGLRDSWIVIFERLEVQGREDHSSYNLSGWIQGIIKNALNRMNSLRTCKVSRSPQPACPRAVHSSA